MVGKHFSQEALELLLAFKAESSARPSSPLGKAWQDGVALLDGPLRNVA